MRYVRLIAACDEYDDKPGLIVKGTPQTEGMMADRDGTLVAHDLLEHQNGAEHIGRVWDELEALGGIWHVRGRHGDLMQKHGSIYSVAENVASDLTRMFEEWIADGAPPFAHRLKATKPHDCDKDFLEIIAISRRSIPREYSALRAQLASYLDEALHRMRTGYRKAERRFGDGYKSNSLFAAIKSAVASAFIDFEGQEFILGYGNGDATIREVIFDEDDY